MGLLYNPDQMPEAELKATFVARQSLVDEIISLIERQSDGAVVQHLLLIAPQGAGKTTVMRMVKFAIADRGLRDKWQAVKFTEESPSIYDLADFWLEVLKLLAADTRDKELQRRIKELESQYRNNEDLQEAALALIQDWRREHDKRLVLLVENFDMILRQINDEGDNARLRSVLLNDGAMMLIGSANSIFKEAREYDQALYNFFKIENLADLRFEQMKELLLKRAEVDKVENFEEKIEQNRGRLRALEYFTGGNPRLVLLLYRVVKNSALKDIQRELEKLLDEVTPLFKHKLEYLPPQQRKILDYIARVSGITREGVTPGEIAEAVRLAPNQVSSQLKRLAELGYVRTANLRRRASYYVLSEPLYAIWYQMRFGRRQGERLGWFITFLKVFFTREEMPATSSNVDLHFRKRWQGGRLEVACHTLALPDDKPEAMEDIPIRIRAKERVIRRYLEINDTETVKRDLLATVNLEELSKEMLEELVESGCINEEQALRATVRKNLTAASEEEKEFATEMALASMTYLKGKVEDALPHFDQALAIKPNDYQAWNDRGVALHDLGRHLEAITSYDRALEINPSDDAAWFNRALALSRTGRYEEAINSYDRALDINPDIEIAWYNRAVELAQRKRYDEAIASFDHALDLKPDTDDAWYNRGIALGKLGRHAEAITSFDRALELNPKDDEARDKRGVAYLKRAIDCIRSGNIDAAKSDWLEGMQAYRNTLDASWQAAVSELLLILSQEGHLKIVRALIAESQLEEEMFPLLRAIDYEQADEETKQEELLEKLSPEVRGIVEMLIAKLSPSSKVPKLSPLRPPSGKKRSRKR